jgi:uronate dehydrogenase
MHEMQSRRVVITGAAGSIGRCAVRGLSQRGHRVLAIDVVDRPPEGAAEFRQVDITNPAALDDAFASQDVVIHLAAIPTDADFMTKLLPANYVGVYQMYEAAKRAKLGRVITTSTSQVIFGHDLEKQLVRADAAYAPVNHYAVSKITMEEMGKFYARCHGMQVLVVRPGWLSQNLGQFKGIGPSKVTRNYYLSHDDAARFFVAAVETDKLSRPGFHVVYAVSRGEDDTVGVDRSPARELLGYEGKDRWPEGTPEFADK